MNQVGDIKTFALAPVTAPEGTNIYAFVWDFWDGSTEVTEGTQVQKRLNIGGAPESEADARILDYRCYPVLADGQAGSIYGTVEVNNPPTIYDAEISKNNSYFPYTSVLKVKAFDADVQLPTYTYLAVDGFTFDVLNNAASWVPGATLADGVLTLNNDGAVADNASYSVPISGYVRGSFDATYNSSDINVEVFFDGVSILVSSDSSCTFEATGTGVLSFYFSNLTGSGASFPSAITITNLVVETRTYNAITDPALQFAWYEGGVLLSGPSLGYTSETTEGTWVGNGRTVINDYAADVGTYAAAVNNDRTIRCYVYDSDAGTSYVDFDLYGKPTPPPSPLLYADPEAATEASASTYKVRVGPEQYLTLRAYARDLSGVSEPTFTWSYKAIDGWQGTTSFTDPAPEELAGGVWMSTSIKYTGTEVVSGTDISVVTARCHVENDYGEVDVPFVIELLSNTVPGAPVVYASINGAAEVTSTAMEDSVLSGGALDVIKFRVTAADPDYDLVNAEWYFSSGATLLNAGTLQDAGSLFGHTVWLNASPDWPAVNHMSVNVKVKDRFGAARSVSVLGPTIDV